MLNSRDDITIVGEAEDGLEAIRQIRKTTPDLVLLDLSMPKLGGVSVLREVKRELPETRILAVHANLNHFGCRSTDDFQGVA